MKKSTLLIGIIIGLLACNGLLLFFVLRPQKGPGLDGPKNFIVEKLHLDTDQIALYDDLIQEHKQRLRKTENGIRESKNALFQSLNEDVSQEHADSLIQVINGYQAEMEKLHYDHFLALKKLCTPEQLPAFEELTTELGRLFGPKHPPRRGK